MNNNLVIDITAEGLYKILDQAFKTNNDKALEVLSKLEIKTNWKEFFKLVRGN